MEITSTTLVLVGVVCVVLGFIASVLLNTLREESELAAGGDDTPPGARKGGYRPVARLWREISTGSLLIEVGGKTLLGRDALSSEQRADLETTERDLRSWLGLSASEAPARLGPAPAAPLGANTAGYDSPGDLERVTGALSPAVSRSRSAAPVVIPALEETVPAVGPASIVMQIEGILQEMIAGTPLARRPVHITEDPIRGVIVQVGLERYEGIDSVPDPQVKAAIQSAVKEWENRQ